MQRLQGLEPTTHHLQRRAAARCHHRKPQLREVREILKKCRGLLRPGNGPAETKYRLIDVEKTHHGVSPLARVLGMSRQGYYTWGQRGSTRRAPPELVRLLAAASSDRAAEQPKGKDAAVAAFLQARSLPAGRPRRLSASVSLKAALIGILVGPRRRRHRSGRLTAPARSARRHPHPPHPHPDAVRHDPDAPARLGIPRPGPAPEPQAADADAAWHPPTDSSQSAGLGISTGPLPTTAVPKIPDPAKSLKGKGSKTPTVKLPKPPRSRCPGRLHAEPR
jgi:hypothetical protein